MESTMDLPNDRRYLESHEWHKLEGAIATLGITQIAADELTDVTYVSLPKVGDTITAGSRFGEIESVKATSDMYTGLSGTVTEVNPALSGDPGLVNREPYTTGWMLKIKVSDPAEMDKLLSVEDYLKKTGH
jgi:glycine cleavage system H protein